MLKSDHERAICEFVRNEIISVRTGEVIELDDRPEDHIRNAKVVEELWRSPSRRYAAEHTRIETFEGQIQNESLTQRLLTPVRAELTGVLPGTFVLSYRAKDLAAARIKFRSAQLEIYKAVVSTASTMEVGATRALNAASLPFLLQLHRRHANGSQVFLQCDVEGEREALRLERLRRALAAKLPKLRAWAADGRTSVLILEANDIQHSSATVVMKALVAALPERVDQPDLVVLVETDGGPWYGWVLKDGERTGDAVPTPNGEYCYTQRQLPESTG